MKIGAQVLKVYWKHRRYDQCWDPAHRPNCQMSLTLRDNCCSLFMFRSFSFYASTLSLSHTPPGRLSTLWQTHTAEANLHNCYVNPVNTSLWTITKQSSHVFASAVDTEPHSLHHSQTVWVPLWSDGLAAIRLKLQFIFFSLCPLKIRKGWRQSYGCGRVILLSGTGSH